LECFTIICSGAESSKKQYTRNFYTFSMPGWTLIAWLNSSEVKFLSLFKDDRYKYSDKANNCREQWETILIRRKIWTSSSSAGRLTIIFVSPLKMNNKTTFFCFLSSLNYLPSISIRWCSFFVDTHILFCKSFLWHNSSSGFYRIFFILLWKSFDVVAGQTLPRHLRN
jgi:hypothetical protein